MRILLVRHTEVEEKSQRRFIGRSDVNLSPLGLESAQIMARKLSVTFSPKKLFCSPMKRCRQLAGHLSEFSGLKANIDPRVQEFDFGRWEGLSFEEVYESDPDADILFPPGGERLELFRERIFSFWKEEVLTFKEDLIVVTHGGTIKVLLTVLQNMPAENFWDIHLGYGAVNEVEVGENGKVQIHRINDLTFLEES